MNATVEKLDLRGCGIGDAGAAALAEALCSNTSVTKLALGLNRIGKQAKQLLRDAVAGRSRLNPYARGIELELYDDDHEDPYED